MASICDFVSKFDSKLKNMKFSASLRLRGGKATFFQTSQVIFLTWHIEICHATSVTYMSAKILTTISPPPKHSDGVPRWF